MSTKIVGGVPDKLMGMRALYLSLAAVFCVVAILIQLFDASSLLAVLALVIAGIFLVLGLKVAAENRVEGPIVLDEDKKATLRELKAQGNESGAIRQVQLWFRDATPERARALVRELE